MPRPPVERRETKVVAVTKRSQIIPIMKTSGAISGKYPAAARKLAPIMGKLPIKIGQAMTFRTPYSPRLASVMPLARAHQMVKSVSAITNLPNEAVLDGRCQENCHDEREEENSQRSI